MAGNLGGAPPLLGFDRDQERNVAIAAEHSLFFVHVRLCRSYGADNKEEEALELDEEAEEKYDSVAKAVQRAEKLKGCAPIIPYNSPDRFSTGFAVATNDTHLRILTCAHVLSDTYTEGKHGELTVEDLRKTFTFGVHCVHQESNVRAMDIDQIISERKRQSTPAKIVALDSELDLLVLEVESGELVASQDDEGFDIACEEAHPVISFSNEDPKKMQKLVLIGWPPQKPGASVTGQVSHSEWNYDAVTSLNVKAYTMKLLEVSGMAGDSGFSGAPVLNGNGEGVGVYHGIFNLINGYAVCRKDVIKFLKAHHMLDWVPEER